jgi:hypothetical protein
VKIYIYIAKSKSFRKDDNDKMEDIYAHNGINPNAGESPSVFDDACNNA